MTMLILLTYMLVGLISGRVTRNRLGINHIQHHSVYCPLRNRDRGNCLNISCKHNGIHPGKIAGVVLAAIFWPFAMVSFFLFTEKLPRLPHKETSEERFQRMLATDPTFAGIYHDLNNQFKVDK